MTKKYVPLILSLAVLSTLGVTYTQCGRSAHLYGSSKEEINALQGPIFTFPEVDPITDIDGDDPTSDPGDPNDPGNPNNPGDPGNPNDPQTTKDSTIPTNPYKPDQEPFKWVTACNELEAPAGSAQREAYIQKVKGDTNVVPGVAPYENIKTSREFELAVVRKIVEDRIKDIKAGKNLPLIIPVEYSFSTGDKHDKISYMAYRRSILRNDTDGVSYIPTSKKTYIVEHENARSHFLEGRFKYYSFVQVKSVGPLSQDVYKPFVKDQPFDAWMAYNMHLQGSGLNYIQDYILHYDVANQLPLGRIYLADIRDDILPFTIPMNQMYPDVSVNGRNSEVSRRLKDIFNLKNIFHNSEVLKHAYVLDRTINAKGFQGTYTGYSGMPQLIHKMNCDVGSTTALATQYTPIVLDLGEPSIRTSSDTWGTFFNLANAKILENGVPLPNVGENTFTHRTAWVGGLLKKVPNPVLPLLSTDKVATPPAQVWQRVAEDGFLVLPTNDGQALTATNLFGASFINPAKPEEKYEDGFKALQDFAGTESACAVPLDKVSYQGDPSEEVLNARYAQIKARYLGPWNENFYKLKIWVDANRDGVSQSSELTGLLQAGVMAINTCLVSQSNTEETDRFGNNTKLRSAFLYDKSLVSGVTATEEEMKNILRVITLGKKSSGEAGNFRLMVDIFFKARPFHFLERSLNYRDTQTHKLYQVKIGDNVYDEDDSDLPMIFK